MSGVNHRPSCLSRVYTYTLELCRAFVRRKSDGVHQISVSSDDITSTITMSSIWQRLPTEILWKIAEFAQEKGTIIDPPVIHCSGCVFQTYYRIKFPAREGITAHDYYIPLTTQRQRKTRSCIPLKKLTRGRAVSNSSLNSLLVNTKFYQHGLQVLYNNNTFIFSDSTVLASFAEHEPYAARNIKKLTLLVEVIQITAKEHLLQWVPRPELHYLISYDHQARSSYVRCAPSLINDRRMTKTFLPDGSPGLSASFPQVTDLTIHVIGWEELIYLQPHLMDDYEGYKLLRSEPLLDELGGAEYTHPPSSIVQGATFISWFKLLSRGGWRADNVRVSGMEDCMDQEYIRKLEDLLRRNQSQPHL